MRREQRGVTMFGLIVVAIILVVGAIGGMKVAPAYIEYFSVKKVVASIIGSGELRNATVADVRKAFDRRAVVDDVAVISGADLEITKEAGELVVSFAYPKKVHLFGNVSLLFEFAGSSQK